MIPNMKKNVLKKKTQGKAAAGANKTFDGITLSWNAPQRHHPLIAILLLLLTNTLFLLKCFIWSFLRRDTQALTKCTYNYLSLHHWNPFNQDLVLCLRPAGGGQALCSNSLVPFPAISLHLTQADLCQKNHIIFQITNSLYCVAFTLFKSYSCDISVSIRPVRADAMVVKSKSSLGTHDPICPRVALLHQENRVFFFFKWVLSTA